MVKLHAVVARLGMPDGDFSRVMGADVVQDDVKLALGIEMQDLVGPARRGHV